MTKYAVAAILVGLFATSALAQPVSGPWFVGLNTATGKCSVVTSMAEGMKMMGKYNTKAEAEAAMGGMKECKG